MTEFYTVLADAAQLHQVLLSGSWEQSQVERWVLGQTLSGLLAGIVKGAA